MKPPRTKPELRLAALGLVWLSALAAGTGWMSWYTRLPGQVSGAPTRWPRESTVARDPARFTLLLFLHPQCPCSRATLAELERFLARAGNGCAVRVLFVEPPEAPAAWEKGPLWDQARAISGLAVRADRNAAEAERFHAATSGWTLLYGPQGDLLFQGGITPSRGHEGDNAGSDTLDRLVAGGSPASEASVPVFGCALVEPEQKRISWNKP